eukprot:TRINITY_DN10658_c0_g1_i3.p1 TRINITY_DN10658_c0_g1~~TRINITY_DN10658_c0_g1_i3.p1  ORF type:complete len:430 (+),score=118.69 TRINITY_DN10658_c0_g1_i3:28-1317(+)
MSPPVHRACPAMGEPAVGVEGGAMPGLGNALAKLGAQNAQERSDLNLPASQKKKTKKKASVLAITGDSDASPDPTPDPSPMNKEKEKKEDSRSLSTQDDVEVDWEKQLGRGSEGVVYVGYAPPRNAVPEKGKEKKASKQVAVKVIKGTPGPENPKDDELFVTLQQHRSTTVKIYGELKGSRDKWVVMEHMDYGSVAHLIDKYNRAANRDGSSPVMTQHPEVVQSMAYQCLKAMEWMHDMKFMHRDIKPDNFLVNRKGEVKLADFTTAKQMDRLGQANTYIGTNYYFSPERLAEKPYSEKGDIWGLGLLLLEFMTCKRLFPKNKKLDVFMILSRMEQVPNEIPAELDADATNFLQMMLHPDPDRRFSVKQLLEHRYITSIGLTTDKLGGLGVAHQTMLSFFDMIRELKRSRRLQTRSSSPATPGFPPTAP